MFQRSICRKTGSALVAGLLLAQAQFAGADAPRPATSAPRTTYTPANPMEVPSFTSPRLLNRISEQERALLGAAEVQRRASCKKESDNCTAFTRTTEDILKSLEEKYFSPVAVLEMDAVCRIGGETYHGAPECAAMAKKWVGENKKISKRKTVEEDSLGDFDDPFVEITYRDIRDAFIVRHVGLLGKDKLDENCIGDISKKAISILENSYKELKKFTDDEIEHFSTQLFNAIQYSSELMKMYVAFDALRDFSGPSFDYRSNMNVLTTQEAKLAREMFAGSGDGFGYGECEKKFYDRYRPLLLVLFGWVNEGLCRKDVDFPSDRTERYKKGIPLMMANAMADYLVCKKNVASQGQESIH